MCRSPRSSSFRARSGWWFVPRDTGGDAVFFMYGVIQEHQKGNKNIIIENPDLKQVVYVFKFVRLCYI